VRSSNGSSSQSSTSLLLLSSSSSSLCPHPRNLATSQPRELPHRPPQLGPGISGSRRWVFAITFFATRPAKTGLEPAYCRPLAPGLYTVICLERLQHLVPIQTASDGPLVCEAPNSLEAIVRNAMLHPDKTSGASVETAPLSSAPPPLLLLGADVGTGALPPSVPISISCSHTPHSLPNIACKEPPSNPLRAIALSPMPSDLESNPMPPPQ
jgi:hypothetical protein